MPTTSFVARLPSTKSGDGKICVDRTLHVDVRRPLHRLRRAPVIRPRGEAVFFDIVRVLARRTEEINMQINLRPALAGLTLSFCLVGPPVALAQDIVDTAVKAGSFNTLVAAVKAADLVGTLKGKGPFTVFAPTDAAFAKLPAGTVESLLKPENKGKLQAILTYHVVAGKFDAKRITSAKAKRYSIKSVQGSNLPIDIRKGVRVSRANVVTADVGASNGVIHVIDTVLLPPAKKRPKHH